MPQKTVYVREEDRELWERAAKLSDGSLASVLADALRAHLDRHAAVSHDSPQDGPAIAAPFGEKMIQLEIRLFTDEIASAGTREWSRFRPTEATGSGRVILCRLTHSSNSLRRSKSCSLSRASSCTQAVARRNTCGRGLPRRKGATNGLCQIRLAQASRAVSTSSR